MPKNVKIWLLVITTFMVGTCIGAIAGCSGANWKAADQSPAVAENLVRLVCSDITNAEQDGYKACQYADAIIASGHLSEVLAVGECASEYKPISSDFLECITDIGSDALLAEKLRQATDGVK